MSDKPNTQNIHDRSATQHIAAGVADCQDKYFDLLLKISSSDHNMTCLEYMDKYVNTELECGKNTPEDHKSLINMKHDIDTYKAGDPIKGEQTASNLFSLTPFLRLNRYTVKHSLSVPNRFKYFMYNLTSLGEDDDGETLKKNSDELIKKLTEEKLIKLIHELPE